MYIWPYNIKKQDISFKIKTTICKENLGICHACLIVIGNDRSTVATKIGFRYKLKKRRSQRILPLKGLAGVTIQVTIMFFRITITNGFRVYSNYCTLQDEITSCFSLAQISVLVSGICRAWHKAERKRSNYGKLTPCRCGQDLWGGGSNYRITHRKTRC